MTSRDDVWRKYVETYPIEVPQERVDSELQFLLLDMRHRMQYDTLTTGALHLNPYEELADQMDDLKAAALHEAKSDLVMKELLARHEFPVTREELEAEAEAMARRQDTTVELIRRFFGEDLSMLERGLREQKAIDWALTQAKS